MKNVFRILVVAVVFFTLNSCTKENSAFNSESVTDGSVGSSLLDVNCLWNVTASGFNVDCLIRVACIERPDGTLDCSQPVPPPPPPSTTVTITKFTSNGTAPVTSFTVTAGQTLGPIPISIQAVGGKIEFSGRAAVTINVSTPAGTNSVSFVPNFPKPSKFQRCDKALFTTKINNFGIGTDCSVSF